MSVIISLAITSLLVEELATSGNKLGAKLRDDFEKKMTSADISTAQKLARECVRKKYKGC